MQLYVATNLTDLHREPSFLAEMLTQILYGMSMEVLEEKDKWSRVRMQDGYEGWAYRPFVASGPVAGATHVVISPCLGIHAEPKRCGLAKSLLHAGTQVHVLEEQDDVVRIAPAGGMIADGWVALKGLHRLDELPLAPHEARREILNFARMLTGVYYLWGGNTCFGTDCSGLSWLAHRICGYSIPRDSHPQFVAGTPVDPPFQPGDLLFFHKDNNPDRIGHVGISVGGWNMIHSSRSRNGVYEEDVQTNEGLKRTFAGARSFVAR